MGNAASPCLKYYLILFCNSNATDLAAEHIVNILSKSTMGFFIFIHLIKKKKKKTKNKKAKSW